MVLVAAVDVIQNLPDGAGILSQPFLVVDICTVTPDNSWVWQPLSLVSMGCCPEIATTFSHLRGLAHVKKAACLIDATSDKTSCTFPASLWQTATSNGPDLHAVSSAKPACHPALVHHQILVNRIPDSSGKVFYCHLLIPTTPMPCVLRNVPVAALDHLRGGESIIPLPQPASSSDAEITLRNLVETTQDVDRVQHI